MRSGVPPRAVTDVDDLAELKRIGTERYAYHVAAAVTPYLRSRRSHFQASGKLNIPGRISVPRLLLPLADFPEIVAKLEDISLDKLRDISFEDILNVRKFEKPAMPLQQTLTSDTPLPEYFDFIPRTNQERVQNLADVFSEHGTEIFEESTKMDGSSMTVFYLNDANPLISTVPSETIHNGVAVCSRNLNRAEGKGTNGRKREGIVFKREDGQFSFKAISNSYLLTHGE
ncbi:hypothetical protein J7337_000974 [Fusarium musae]|uniref:DNA ligase n=1 Tax=Fusarium musae TaxID=1042133 RepID=A0A9P8DSL7_9HYPO|nr:hypothetical protein J7337_000974 [Fusarium musae]KAG9507422.1 hypothetical protein J7337_000974 [Fusarium musae]